MKPNAYIDSLLTELMEVWELATELMAALSLRYPASHLVRKGFTLDESEQKAWIVVIVFPSDNKVAIPIPDEYLWKFKHLDEGPMLEDDVSDEALLHWKERLLAWAKK